MRRLPWSQRISYGVGHALNDLCASMWFSYLIVYLQLVLGFDSSYAGLVLLIGQVADAFATPLLGIEASTPPKPGGFCQRYGKRKTLHLFGTLCVILTFPFIFSVCPGCERASEMALTVMLVPLVVIFQVGWAAVQVSHLSLIPAITPHEGERDFLNVLRYAVDIASDIGTYLVVWCVFDLTRTPSGNQNKITREYANKFMIIVLVLEGIGAFFSIIFHWGVKETNFSITSPEEDKLKRSPHLSWREWLKEAHFYQVGLLYTFTRLFQNMSIVFMPLYLQESLRADDDFIAKIPLVMNVAGFAVSCTLPKFFKVFSKKIAFIGGACMGVGASVWMSMGHGTTFCSQGIYAVGALSGAAASMLVVSTLSFTHDLIGDSSESGAFVYGCMSFLDKLFNGVVAMIIQHRHSISCHGCDWFYRDVMTWGVGGIAILSSIILITLLPAQLGQRFGKENVPLKNKISIIKIEEKQPLLMKSELSTVD